MRLPKAWKIYSQPMINIFKAIENPVEISKRFLFVLLSLNQSLWKNRHLLWAIVKKWWGPHIRALRNWGLALILAKQIKVEIKEVRLKTKKKIPDWTIMEHKRKETKLIWKAVSRRLLKIMILRSIETTVQRKPSLSQQVNISILAVLDTSMLN